MSDFLDNNKYYLNNDGRLLSDSLKEYYPHILSAIEKEGYLIEFEEYDKFYEITYKNQIVGFITLEIHPLVDNILSINESYVIPKFRGKNLLYKLLKTLILDENHEILIQRPNISFMKVLKKNNLCYKLTKDLLVSYIKFHINLDYIYYNFKIEKFYNKDYADIPYKANVFDLSRSLSMLRDPKSNFIKSDDFFACVQPRKGDLKKYNLYNKLKNIDEDYLNENFMFWHFSNTEITEFLESSEIDLLESIDVHNLIGSSDKLNHKFTKKLKENHLSTEDGFKIRKHIIKSQYKNQLSEKSTPQRILYLLKHFDKVDFEIDDVNDNMVMCPFCNSQIPDNYNSCSTCGLHIRDIDFEEYAIKSNFKFRYLIFAFFFFIIYKIVKLFKRK